MADHHSDGSQGASAHNHEPRTRPQRGWSHSSSPDVYADGAGEDRFGERRLLDDDALEDEVERAVEAYEAGQEFSGVNDTEERLATLMTLLAMPSFVESLSIMSTFVIGYFSDIWNDFEFINTMTLVGPVVRDWFILTAILFVPLGTFARIDIDDWQRMKAMRESRFVYAEPKIWVAILLVIFTFAIFVGIPMYGFSQLGVGGYAAFFAVACCLSIQRFVFNVPSLVENFGPKAVNSLELPLFDFIEENEDQVDAAIKAMEEAGSPGPGMGLRSLDRRSFSSSLSSIRLDASDERDESSRLRTGMQDQAQAGRSGSGARRVHLVLTRMAQQQIRTFWMGSFALAVIAMIVLVGFSVDQDTTLSDYQGIPLHGNATHRTHVVPAPSRSKVGFMYPVCTLFDTLYAGKDEPGFVSATMPGDMQQGGGETGHFAAIAEAKLTTLDFVFLSDLAYSHAQTSQQQLDRWFGPKAVRYIPPDKYDQYAAPRLSSAVFKLLHIPSRAAGGDGGDREVFLVTVRGTINTYDLLSDMQIWFPAMLFQWLRFVLPFGAVWNSVIPSLIKYMNVLETAPSNQLSYQADLTNFVRALRAKNPDAFVAITGHSLGGGIAMLVGAAESVPAIGISGPNSVLSSLKFGFNQSMLDAFAVNIIPRGDPIPTVDDQALLTENILCRVGRGAYLGACHELKRTFCELQYICGSGDRPPVSICNTIYQFPAAIHLHNASDSP
ncbi:Hypothetical Protein FCC1311_034351 [Hondaea fermentalgiana]|uniref:Fungal lipase-type domain-containing protein n=1 Tax=Hondaea fermentalgiana TaxID=2315210 RepID=A0A2R5GSL4_9STRA|nr:Hypothetical Protein FCC1311_034351 [Hondaea fermentalgiana]|eukprot:GBG33299.1 Hypothetical Protein FCC1311_034351 [Hondaea fermentalgiana]